MFKADQNQLHHETNQGLIEIRQSEISYHVNVNSAMGTQAALLGGFTYGIFTQNLKNKSTSYIDEVSGAYYVAVAITIASSLHVIINTMMLQVLGPGLSLNGPIGSMARAAEGMNAEQGQVFWSFSVMIAAFAAATVLDFWVIMDLWSAVVSSIVFMIGAWVTLMYSKRVCLEFHWDKSKNTPGDWADRDADDDDEPTIAGKLASRTMSADAKTGKQSSSRGSPEKSGSKESGRFDILNWFSGKNKEGGEAKGSDEVPSGQTVLQPKDVAMEGYMTKRGVSRTGISGKLVKEPWERRYFVLNGRGQMYYYRNRQDYRTDAVEGRIKARPIELGEYHVVTGVDGVADSDTATVTTAITTGGSAVPSFQLTLRPREEEGQSRHWHLRCDTEEVLAVWIAAMNRVSPESFSNRS